MSYAGRVLVAIALVGGALLLWMTRQLVLLVFGGVLFAVVLSSFAGLLRRWCRLGHRAAVGLAVTVLLLALAGVTAWLGNEMAAQLRELSDRLPRAVAAFRQWLGSAALGPHIIEQWDELRSGGVPWQRIAGAAGFTLGALGNFILMLLLGVFIAAEPELYRAGTLRLVPVPHRERVGRALDACGAALRGWLKGQGLSMLFVGVATAAGLWLLDVPLALILGLVAGLLDFVPFFGPLASGVLAVLLAFTEGPQTALYVALLALGIQQVEGNLMMPLVQRWAVQLPPALGVVAVVLVAGIFGLPGILFATPLIVVAMVLVRKLYVEGVLEAQAPQPASPRGPSPNAR